MVKISGPNRLAKITDHFTFISVNVIYYITCTQCKNIYTGESGRRLADRFRELPRDVGTQMRQNQLRAVLIFRITTTITWQFAGVSLHHGNAERRKSLEQKYFNLAHCIHTESMNASHSLNYITNSCHHISATGKAPPHQKQQYPTIPLFFLTKD